MGMVARQYTKEYKAAQALRERRCRATFGLMNSDSALAVLGEVATYLGAGLGVDEALGGVVGVLQRGLGVSDSRIWLRSAEGHGFRCVQAEGSVPPETEQAGEVARWVLRGQPPAWTAEEPFVRIPLIHQGEHLGLLECAVPDGPDAARGRQVVALVAQFLAPLLSTIELSEDLASEVAARTREIEAQRRFTAKIIDSLPVGLYVIDRQFRIQAWNRKRETGTQGVARHDVLGHTVFDVLHRQPRELLRQEFETVFGTGAIQEVDVATQSDGETRYYRITKIPMRLDDDDITHVITIGEDITQSKRVQQQVTQTEKMAAVGQLAAGVMHEINNPLATIGVCVEALSVRLPDLPLTSRAAFTEYLNILESEIDRCKTIVGGLLDFSRPQARVKKTAVLNQIVEDALFLVRYHDRFRKVSVERQFAPDLPVIEANTEQLIQVFLDLMMNAVDAMSGEGALTVVTGMNPERADEVVVEIRDTGVGIHREVLSKIFEPFFTTKPPGSGTGLGLSIAYSIVANHNGRVEVDSDVGKGSTFRVFLPIRHPDAL